MDLTQVKASLEKNGFTVSVFEDAAAAAAYLNGSVDGVTVGFGGSVTLEELGLYDLLSAHNTVYSHWHCAADKKAETLRAAQTADVYMASVNGLAETGEIVNIDGTGNRVSGIQFGHRKVYLIAGSNKLAPDLTAAVERARNIAAPKNAQRLCRKTPCAEKGDRCYDCASPERICRGVSVLLKKPGGCDYEVVLVGTALGY